MQNCRCRSLGSFYVSMGPSQQIKRFLILKRNWEFKFLPTALIMAARQLAGRRAIIFYC